MSIRVGDSVFTRQGIPNVIQGKKADKEQLVVSQDPKIVKSKLRNGYINGMSVDDRDSFNDIMDEMRTIKDPEERAMELRKRLTTLEEDPRQHMLSRYVRSELMHLMNSYGIRPREFVVEEAKVKT